MLDEINFLKYILKNSESADVQGEGGGSYKNIPLRAQIHFYVKRKMQFDLKIEILWSV